MRKVSSGSNTQSLEVVAVLVHKNLVIVWWWIINQMGYYHECFPSPCSLLLIFFHVMPLPACVSSPKP